MTKTAANTVFADAFEHGRVGVDGRAEVAVAGLPVPPLKDYAPTELKEAAPRARQIHPTHHVEDKGYYTSDPCCVICGIAWESPYALARPCKGKQ